MKFPARIPFVRARLSGQRGVALFFALICMVAIMLAAVMLVRSVDTATLIAGNLAFQQSATRSGDGGTEAAIAWLANVQTAYATTNPLSDLTHPFNTDKPNVTMPTWNGVFNGYLASVDPAKSLTATVGSHFLWDTTDSCCGPLPGIGPDAAGNTVRYIIQRMCQTSGWAIANTNCLFSGAALDNNGQNIPLPQQICNGPGCPVAGQTPMIRVTTKVTGPKNTVSYVQALIY